MASWTFFDFMICSYDWNRLKEIIVENWYIYIYFYISNNYELFYLMSKMSIVIMLCRIVWLVLLLLYNNTSS